MTERKLLCFSDHNYFQEEGGAERPGLPEFLEGVVVLQAIKHFRGMMGHAGLTFPSSPHSALCTYLEPESCFVVCGGRGLGAAGGLGNSLSFPGLQLTRLDDIIQFCGLLRAA